MFQVTLTKIRCIGEYCEAETPSYPTSPFGAAWWEFKRQEHTWSAVLCVGWVTQICRPSFSPEYWGRNTTNCLARSACSLYLVSSEPCLFIYPSSPLLTPCLETRISYPAAEETPRSSLLQIVKSHPVVCIVSQNIIGLEEKKISPLKTNILCATGGEQKRQKATPQSEVFATTQ